MRSVASPLALVPRTARISHTARLLLRPPRKLREGHPSKCSLERSEARIPLGDAIRRDVTTSRGLDRGRRNGLPTGASGEHRSTTRRSNFCRSCSPLSNDVGNSTSTHCVRSSGDQSSQRTAARWPAGIVLIRNWQESRSKMSQSGSRILVFF